jgi:hypothetical protein
VPEHGGGVATALNNCSARLCRPWDMTRECVGHDCKGVDRRVCCSPTWGTPSVVAQGARGLRSRGGGVPAPTHPPQGGLAVVHVSGPALALGVTRRARGAPLQLQEHPTQQSQQHPSPNNNVTTTAAVTATPTTVATAIVAATVTVNNSNTNNCRNCNSRSNNSTSNKGDWMHVCES